MDKKLGFYTVTKEYVKYLKNFENKIMDNEEKKEKRPYIGIILKVDNHNYFAPLSSPKPKHVKLKKSVDFFAIDSGKLGGINLNNMIPIKEGFFKKIDIENEFDEKYKILLKKQLVWCNLKDNKKNIIKKAEKLYSIITTQRKNSKLWNRCCDFSLLEEKASEYEKTKKFYNPLTGKIIPILEAEKEKLSNINDKRLIPSGELSKNNITIKEKQTPITLNVFFKKDNKLVMKEVKFFSIEQLNIPKTIELKPFDESRQPNLMKNKEIKGIER